MAIGCIPLARIHCPQAQGLLMGLLLFRDLSLLANHGQEMHGYKYPQSEPRAPTCQPQAITWHRPGCVPRRARDPIVARCARRPPGRPQKLKQPSGVLGLARALPLAVSAAWR